MAGDAGQAGDESGPQGGDEDTVGVVEAVAPSADPEVPAWFDTSLTVDLPVESPLLGTVGREPTCADWLWGTKRVTDALLDQHIRRNAKIDEILAAQEGSVRWRLLRDDLSDIQRDLVSTRDYRNNLLAQVCPPDRAEAQDYVDAVQARIREIFKHYP